MLIHVEHSLLPKPCWCCVVLFYRSDLLGLLRGCMRHILHSCTSQR
uniref:Uncharacterized protein n=1 Tax=Rhizophora mucronata TaxID=61149 RepID=A0A2P2MAZ4_RHIMU